jgi:hypothetical protein
VITEFVLIGWGEAESGDSLVMLAQGEIWRFFQNESGGEMPGEGKLDGTALWA